MCELSSSLRESGVSACEREFREGHHSSRSAGEQFQREGRSGRKAPAQVLRTATRSSSYSSSLSSGDKKANAKLIVTERRRARHPYAASKLSRHLAANSPARCIAGAMPEFYNGAIDFQPVEEEDQRPKINAACEPGCSSAWKNYLACGERIEAKVGP